MARNEHTSQKVAKTASKLLSSSKSKAVKSVSASALTQARNRKRSK